ncbi:MAG: DNA replication/repair protein RecF [Paludibacteraceae bacterium]|nr:DNA replication/repair protein RecF [Paludibacteraceae bacterium]
MKLKHLSVVNYKNILSCELDFSDKINCFVGRNGMGKTNILDAIYYLSFCKSHTNSIDSQVVAHDEEFLVLQGVYERKSLEENIYCGIKRRQKKQFKRNKVAYTKYSEHIGFLPLVLVSPADSSLILDGSEERRRFMDIVISQYDKTYLNALIRYNTALQNRNSLLKLEVADGLMFDLYEEEMAEAASLIFASRNDFIQRFVPIFQYYYNTLSDGNESVSLKYTSHLFDSQNLIDILRSTRNRDAIIGFSTKGIHKDDLEMLLGDYPIKRIGSQGQNKTYLIALKFAQFDFLKEINDGMSPILLLDDIFDKLDADRVERIIQLVSGNRFGQIFITDTNREHLDEMLSKINYENKIFKVENGNVIF